MQNERRLELVAGVRRVVVKIGSGVLGDDDGWLSEKTLKRLVEDVCALKRKGLEVILVSSGAVMAGRKELGMRGGKLTIPQKQAAAAVGQVKLMKFYEESFSQNGIKTAQILLTHMDIADDYERVLNVRNTVTTLLEMGAVPVINENDTVSDEELKFGDNDTLAAKAASALGMHLLLILSDVDGLYEADPRLNPAAPIISDVTNYQYAAGHAGEGGSQSGAGGMKAKVNAARIALDGGIPTWIVSGKREGAILDALTKGEGGTVFYPGPERLSAKHHWMRHVLQPKGTIIVDDGAKKALMEDGKSLLPSGIMEIKGSFSVGDGVSICDNAGKHLAHGITNYDSNELERIKRKKSSEIEEILGFKRSDEVVHRDNLVFILIPKTGSSGLSGQPLQSPNL